MKVWKLFWGDFEVLQAATQVFFVCNHRRVGERGGFSNGLCLLGVMCVCESSFLAQVRDKTKYFRLHSC